MFSTTVSNDFLLKYTAKDILINIYSRRLHSIFALQNEIQASCVFHFIATLKLYKINVTILQIKRKHVTNASVTPSSVAPLI